LVGRGNNLNPKAGPFRSTNRAITFEVFFKFISEEKREDAFARSAAGSNNRLYNPIKKS